jgi:hypothetical protein
MPVQYRHFYMKKLLNVKEKERDQYEQAQGKSEASSQKVVKGPQLQRSR